MQKKIPSDKGTLFRLFNVSTGEMITELRRGAKNAKINCLAFNSTSELFGCTSDIGTVHIFDIHDVNKILEIEENKKNNNNDNNKKEKSKKYANIKINERSFAKYKLGEEKGILGSHLELIPCLEREVKQITQPLVLPIFKREKAIYFFPK